MSARTLSPLTLANRQLLGGQPWGEVVAGRNSLFICRRCGMEYHLIDNGDPCAFCNDCKDVVLDQLAAALVKLTPRAPRAQRRSR